jgi:hypothetical protein
MATAIVADTTISPCLNHRRNHECTQGRLGWIAIGTHCAHGLLAGHAHHRFRGGRSGAHDRAAAGGGRRAARAAPATSTKASCAWRCSACRPTARCSCCRHSRWATASKSGCGSRQRSLPAASSQRKHRPHSLARTRPAPPTSGTAAWQPARLLQAAACHGRHGAGASGHFSSAHNFCALKTLLLTVVTGIPRGA